MKKLFLIISLFPLYGIAQQGPLPTYDEMIEKKRQQDEKKKREQQVKIDQENKRRQQEDKRKKELEAKINEEHAKFQQEVKRKQQAQEEEAKKQRTQTLLQHLNELKDALNGEFTENLAQINNRLTGIIKEIHRILPNYQHNEVIQNELKNLIRDLGTLQRQTYEKTDAAKNQARELADKGVKPAIQRLFGLISR